MITSKVRNYLLKTLNLIEAIEITKIINDAALPFTMLITIFIVVIQMIVFAILAKVYVVILTRV